MKKIMLLEYVENGMIKTAFIDDVTCYMFMNGKICTDCREISNVRKIDKVIKDGAVVVEK